MVDFWKTNTGKNGMRLELSHSLSLSLRIPIFNLRRSREFCTARVRDWGTKRKKVGALSRLCSHLQIMKRRVLDLGSRLKVPEPSRTDPSPMATLTSVLQYRLQWRGMERFRFQESHSSNKHGLQE